MHFDLFAFYRDTTWKNTPHPPPLISTFRRRDRKSWFGYRQTMQKVAKYSFHSDYSEGAHPYILEALTRTNLS